MNALQINDKTIGDLTALEVGNIGENIAVRRGIFMRANDKELVASYVHATGIVISHICLHAGNPTLASSAKAHSTLVRNSLSVLAPLYLHTLCTPVSLRCG